MSSYRRPWWIIALQAPLLTTSVEEAITGTGSEIFIEGRPTYQSAIWITCAPVLALLGAVLLGVLAGVYGIKEQPRGIVLVFITAIVVTPMLTWLISGQLLSHAANRHLARQAEANTVRLTLRLDDQAGRLHIQEANEPEPPVVPYQEIQRVSLVTSRGTRPTAREAAEKYQLRLVLETRTDQIEILGQTMGTEAFKSQLANRLRQALHAYRRGDD